MLERTAFRSLLCMILIAHYANCDISEYFQKLKSDAQMDFFKKMPPTRYGMESRSPPESDFSDYYDYFGIEPTSNSEFDNSIEDRENELDVASDVLSNVKNPGSSFSKKSLKIKRTNERYPYKKRNPVNYQKDNIAVASAPSPKVMTKRVSRPRTTPKSLPRKTVNLLPPLASNKNDIVDKIQRLVPSKIKTVIEGGGKKIVKTVLQPVQKITNKVRENYKERVEKVNPESIEKVSDSWFSPYRTYLDGIAPIFEQQYVTHQLIATWINAIASSIVWVFLGHFFTAASGRSFSTGTLDEGRSTSSQVFPDVIEELVPDSETVAMVLRGMASAAERWHDEL